MHYDYNHVIKNSVNHYSCYKFIGFFTINTQHYNIKSTLWYSFQILIVHEQLVFLTRPQAHTVSPAASVCVCVCVIDFVRRQHTSLNFFVFDFPLARTKNVVLLTPRRDNTAIVAGKKGVLAVHLRRFKKLRQERKCNVNKKEQKRTRKSSPCTAAMHNDVGVETPRYFHFRPQLH